ncbi:hypothetical protein LPJ57_008144 [Coemansia sp. RSA 486]|nr:hypothetical protein LPJ57_008144 [Coemansia sp. RSA 486]
MASKLPPRFSGLGSVAAGSRQVADHQALARRPCQLRALDALDVVRQRYHDRPVVAEAEVVGHDVL